MLCAPLLTSCDLAHVSQEDLAIMTDAQLLDISQDALGEQAHRASTAGGIWRYEKNLTGGRKAIAVFNTNDSEKDGGENTGKLRAHETKVFVVAGK
jgi:alpha-galactosidase